MSARNLLLEEVVGSAWEAAFTSALYEPEVEIDLGFEAEFDEPELDCGDVYDLPAYDYNPQIAALLRT